MSVWKQFLVLILLAGLAAGGYQAYQRYLAPPEKAATGHRRARSVSVEVAKVVRKRLPRTVEAVGTTRARQSVQVVPLAAGRVVRIAFKPGQHVKAGDVLVKLDDDIQRADLADAEAQLAERSQAVDRAVRLQKQNAVSLASLQQVTAAKSAAEAEVERARSRLADRSIKAPFDGVVGLTNISLGARVDTDTVLTTLDNLSEVEIEFSLPETLFSEIAVGQAVSARSAAFPKRDFTGKVAFIDTRIDPVSRAFKVRAILPNPDGLLPSGMFMSLTLTLSESDALVVPEQAIVVQAADTFVFVIAGGKAERRNVATGARRDGVIAVTSGLKEGELVAISGLVRVRDGSDVKIVGGPGASVKDGT